MAAKRILFFLIGLSGMSLGLTADAFQAGDKRLIYESGEKTSVLIELYTSDVRSSCNKAVDYFNAFKQKDPKTELWKKFVPIVMHVNLWDVPGYKDAFFKKEFAERLATYQKKWGVRQVYPPTIAANGLEWSGWSRGQDIPGIEQAVAGVLKVDGSIKENMFEVTYQPPKNLEGKEFVVYASLLGFGLRSKPSEGSNRNKPLQHEFVALCLKQQELKFKDKQYAGTVELSKKGLWMKEYAVVFWVAQKGDHRSLQATGGYLPV